MSTRAVIPTGRRRNAFTLIELLVTIAIIGILALMIGQFVARARADAARIACLSNLRQLLIAAERYAMTHGGRMPPAYSRNFNTGETLSWEWFLWDDGAESKVHQCPSFKGSGNWMNGAFAGYNYNASYIGGSELVRNGGLLPHSTPSAMIGQIANPAQCAVFGDGEFDGGGNKFMRSPFPGPLDRDGSLALAGTQGFRHRGRTNVGFADGHAESLDARYVTSAGSGEPGAVCGFLSPDNSLYDLE